LVRIIKEVILIPLTHLILRELKPAANVNQFYEIRIDKGLFNSWLVMIGYGRYGEKDLSANL